MAASPDSSSKLSENDGSPDMASPNWDGTGLRSDPMRMGWIVEERAGRARERWSEIEAAEAGQG
jgi:hypothetical protein